MTTPGKEVFHWLMCMSLGLLSTIFLALGHNIYICAGVFDGLIWTVAMTAMIMFFPPEFIGRLVLAGIGMAVAIHFLSGHRFFAKRPELYACLLPVACLFVANWYSYATRADGVCKMGSWM